MSEPRARLEELVEELLKEEGPLSPREIANGLAKQDKAYTVVDGQRFAISHWALSKKMRGYWGIEKMNNGKWKIRNED